MNILSLHCACESDSKILFGIHCCPNCKIAYAYSLEMIEGVYHSAKNALSQLYSEKKIQDLETRQYASKLSVDEEKELALLKRMSEKLNLIASILQNTKNAAINFDLRNPLNMAIYEFLVTLDLIDKEYNLGMR